MTDNKANQTPRKDLYIYDLNQATFYIQHGLTPVAIAKGKYGDVYVRFKHTDELDQVWQKWGEHIARVRSRRKQT